MLFSLGRWVLGGFFTRVNNLVVVISFVDNFLIFVIFLFREEVEYREKGGGLSRVGGSSNGFRIYRLYLDKKVLFLIRFLFRVIN